MQFSILKKNSPFSVYLNIAKIHKTELPDSILSNLAIKQLALLYKLLSELDYLNIYLAIQDKEIVGCLSFNRQLRLSNFFRIRSLYIFYLIIFCYVKKPVSSIFLSYCKYKVYRKVKFDINLPFLFIKKELQGQQIGSKLLNFSLNQVEGVISVDTYVINLIAINFYKNNGFRVVQSYKKIILLLNT